MIVIEMNPRVSRSSALASKATGFPIAKVAAKLAVGYTLDELRNDITGRRNARVVRAVDRLRGGDQDPSFRLREIPGKPIRHLTTQMKSVGEVMAMGRTFQESFQKALRGTRDWRFDGMNDGKLRDDREDASCEEDRAKPTPERIWYVGRCISASGMTVERECLS